MQPTFPKERFKIT